MFNYSSLPHGNVARISLYRALRVLSMTIIFFSWNKSKAETKQFPFYNPTLATATHQQGVTHKHKEPRIWCLLLQVCLLRKDDLCFPAAWWVQIGEKWLWPEVWPTADGQPTHTASTPFSREQSWAGKWTTANGRRQLQQCRSETTFSGLCWVKFKSQKYLFV